MIWFPGSGLPSLYAFLSTCHGIFRNRPWNPVLCQFARLWALESSWHCFVLFAFWRYVPQSNTYLLAATQIPCRQGPCQRTGSQFRICARSGLQNTLPSTYCPTDSLSWFILLLPSLQSKSFGACHLIFSDRVSAGLIATRIVLRHHEYSHYLTLASVGLDCDFLMDHKV